MGWLPEKLTRKDGSEVDWSTSYHGLSAVPFTREQGEVLMRPLEEHEIEMQLREEQMRLVHEQEEADKPCNGLDRL